MSSTLVKFVASATSSSKTIVFFFKYIFPSSFKEMFKVKRASPVWQCGIFNLWIQWASSKMDRNCEELLPQVPPGGAADRQAQQTRDPQGSVLSYDGWIRVSCS